MLVLKMEKFLKKRFIPPKIATSDSTITEMDQIKQKEFQF